MIQHRNREGYWKVQAIGKDTRIHKQEMFIRCLDGATLLTACTCSSPEEAWVHHFGKGFSISYTKDEEKVRVLALPASKAAFETAFLKEDFHVR